jgi:multidrug efflux pump subunit AcrB
MIGDLEGQPNPIEVKIFGDDVEQLASLAEEVEDRLGRIPGVVDIVGVERGTPEVTWQIDPGAAGRLGLTVEAVSRQLQAAWLGEVATDLRLLDRTIPVRVRYPDVFRLNPERLAQTPFAARTAAQSPSSASPSSLRAAASRSCNARTCVRWPSSRAGSKAATLAAPSPMSKELGRSTPARRLRGRGRRTA